MDTELKPCPFCGEEAGICEANDICFHRDDDGNKIFGGWRCFCPSCAIEQIGYETREEAVGAWNNRSTEHATHRAPVDEKGGGRMTGIERLRTLAGEWDAYGLGGTLGDVARQIERERACDADAIENVRLIVGGVIDDMERHVSGVEGADDSPVARWARELREALDGDGRDHADERETIAWVREHGGLGSFKKLLDWVVCHCSTKQQLDFDFWLSGRVMYELGFEEDMADRDEVERRLLARLMPEGMEWLLEAWPRYEDDAPLKLGDMALIDGEADMVEAVQLWIHGKPVIYGDGGSQQLERGERVKRPVADTWERLEEDVANASCPDVYCANHHIDASDTSYEWAMARDLVRRCRALAERERSE